ncbi:MAG TPA: CHAT domain-containing protein [Pyrinomonadaceae bacterium]|nr:CHAT domain-containing protein [Pyrinomonadaceae bacterium]
MADTDHRKSDTRRYLLKQLPDADQTAFELRLLTEDDLHTELEIVEDELIDDYLANELSRDERERFEEHFLTTPERENKMRSAQAMRRYLKNVDPPDPRPTLWQRLKALAFTSPPITVAVSVVLLLAVAVPVWRLAFYQSDLDKGLVALNKAYEQERPNEARISQLDYAPYGTTRGNDPLPVNTLELNRAQVHLLQAEQDQHDAAAYQALGKLYLLQREPDKAIQYLDRAVNADAKNAQIYADLGAAFLEKARLELDPSNTADGKTLKDLGSSLENLNRALELDPNLLEPLFNRALVHQYQGRTEAAKADWRAYLEKDRDSKWAADAREHLQKLENAQSRRPPDSNQTFDTFMRAYRARDDTAAWEIYRGVHSASGNDVTNTLVDRFLAETTSSGTTSENLQALMYLGQLEARQTNDAFTLDLARFYSSTSPQTRALLATARQNMATGRKLVDQASIDEATNLFANARSTFETVGDIPELVAVKRAMAHGFAVQPNLALGQEMIAQVIQESESRHYHWLLAESLTNRAHIQSNLNNYSEAISDGNRALQLFQELHDVRSTLGTFVQLAALYLFLNDTEVSLSFISRAMAVAKAEGVPPEQLWGVHVAASLNLTALHLYRAALDYQTEALQLALQSRRPLIVSRSYQWLGLTYGFLRQFDLALENLHNAYDQGRSSAKDGNGQNMMANASLKLGDIYRLSGDNTSALAAYDESLRLFDALQFGHYSYAAHKGKFLAYLAQSNDALASQELTTVFDLFNSYREKILAERQKNSFFDREHDTCDLAIDFTYFRLGDRDRAFDYSEICRARNLRELMRRGAEVMTSAGGLDLQSRAGAREDTPTPNAFEISQQLPEQVQLVQFSVLDNKVVIWVVKRAGLSATSVDVESAELKKLVMTASRQIRQRDDGAPESLKALYRYLILPIKDQLDQNKVICFVPDKALHYVPFGALLSPDSGHYLAQDYRLMTSPSATIMIASSKKAAIWPAGQAERLLAVGNPAFERAGAPNLSNLPDAEREVKRLALDYPPSPSVLLRQRATRKTVMAELPRANVAHFAAHYQINPRSTLSSKLLLSPEPGERAHSQTAGLDAASIYQMNLENTKLVVLAACQTGIEQQFDGEGPIGFARSFLVAGVPVVVASLWPVDSDATAELMITFHDARRHKQMSVIDALTQAQREMIARDSRNGPYYWAGFTVIGGYSDY